MLDKETAKLVSDASTAFFSKPCVVKSIPSWTSTRVVQDNVSTKQRARENTSLVLASIVMYMMLSKDCSGFYGMKHRRVLRDIPLSCRTVTPREVCIMPYKNSPLVQCLRIIELVPTSAVEVVPWEACKDNPSLHPQLEKVCCCYEKD